jgi:pyrroline-5-carboxylate reductase
MIQGGVANGLQVENATALTLATLSGAVKLMQDLKVDPVELRRRVTSPGGTTEAAINLLEAHKVKDRFVAAISAATRRSRELSQ